MSAPNLKEMEWAIHNLENEESSESRYLLLAALYTCRNELTGGSQKPRIPAYSEAAAPVMREIESYGDSDFLRVVARKDPAAAWRVMDEHMEVLRVVNPRAYDGVLLKLNKI